MALPYRISQEIVCVSEILRADFPDQEGNCQETTHRRGKQASGGTVDLRCRRR